MIKSVPTLAERLHNLLLWYWRTPASIVEVAVWVCVVMVLCPGILFYSGYAIWAIALVVPILLILAVRVLRQFFSAF